MKVLHEIKKGAWAFDLDRINEYHDLAQQVLKGTFNATSLGAKNESPFSFMNENGDQLKQKSTSSNRYYAVVELIGAVMRYDNCYDLGAESIARQMKILNDDPQVAGIIVKGDTPGGAVSAINPFIDFAKIKTKPVVGLFDQCCSLGMWAAATFDFIMAENNISARFGSIGVVCTFQDITEHLEKNGVKQHEIYPDESDYKNKAFRLAKEGKYEMIKKEYLSPMAVQFQNAIKTNRPQLNTSIEGILNGRTFTASDAVDYGLIDSIGTIEDAARMIDVLNDL